MEKRPEIEAEKKEEFGQNVTVIIDLIRHGEKDGPDGLLTEKGKEEARLLGKKIREESPDSAGIKAYHSGVPRARQTAEEIVRDKKLFATRKKEGLALHGQITKETLKEFESKVINAGNEGAAVQWYLDSGDNRPDPGTLSSKEASAEIAREIKNLVDISANFRARTKLNIALVSHSGVIEHFIADALSAERRGFIEKIGGGLGYLEGARLIIHRIDKDDFEIKFKFRGNESTISLQQLEEMAH